jgi:hypothetical protein
MESEHKWATQLPHWPSEEKYADYHGIYLTAHEIAGYKDAAKRLLTEFSNNIIAAERPQFLAATLEQYRTAAYTGHGKFRWRGVWEAVLGACVWTVLLIVVSVIAARGGIDILEIYQKAAGIHRQ